MKTFSIFIALALTITSCNSKSTISSEVKVIPFVVKVNEFVNLSDFCTSIYYVPLETNSSCYISSISKIKIFGDSIFIFNEMGWNMKDILVFNKEGKFLGNFGKSGPGPEEIENPRDISKFKDSYLIWDRIKIAQYDKKGQFRKKLFNAYLPGKNLFSYPDRILIYHGTQPPGLISSFDLNGTSQRIFKPTDPEPKNSTIEGENLIYTDGECHFFAPSLDTVWALSGDQFFPRYVFDFKEDLTLEKFFKKNSDKHGLEMLSLINSTPTSSVQSFNEGNKYIFASYLRSKQMSYKVFSKEKNRQIDFTYCDNDIDNGIFGKAIGMYDDNLIIQLEPIKILSHSNKYKDSKHELFNKFALTIKEDDNPVLMICKLKL